MARAVDGDEGPVARARLVAWSARATSSLPVPLSPVISVADDEFAKCSMSARTRSMAELTPTMRGRASLVAL